MIPALLGALTVLQAGLNRKIAQMWGLPWAVFFNAAVLFLGAAVLLLLAQAAGQGEGVWRVQGEWKQLAWWFFLPGLMGVTLVSGGPWAIGQWGALQTFVLLVGGQVVVSLVWDLKVEGLGISWPRVLGAALTWLGVLLTMRAR